MTNRFREVMSLRGSLILALLLSSIASCGAEETSEHDWRILQPGVEYASFRAGASGKEATLLHVVRIVPSAARVECVSASGRDGVPRTAGEWCKTAGLAVAINAGMFAADGQTNVGYLRSGEHVNNPRWNDYRSVLCLYPRDTRLGTLRWLDREKGQVLHGSVKDYAIVVQNLRLIRSQGHNVWAMSSKKWSEAAVAVDRRGRLLFLFLRAPMTMHAFNHFLLSLPLEIDAAMHVEGGPEASLSIHSGGVDLDLCGSYETGFLQGDSNHRQWEIPNVLGISASRQPASKK